MARSSRSRAMEFSKLEPPPAYNAQAGVPENHPAARGEYHDPGCDAKPVTTARPFDTKSSIK